MSGFFLCFILRNQIDVIVDGTFKTTMAAKDVSFSFDLEGVYTKVELHKYIAYTLPDGRNVEITFTNEDSSVNIIESFYPESQNSHELQQQGWQMILNNFKKHVESLKRRNVSHVFCLMSDVFYLTSNDF